MTSAARQIRWIAAEIAGHPLLWELDMAFDRVREILVAKLQKGLRIVYSGSITKLWEWRLSASLSEDKRGGVIIHGDMVFLADGRFGIFFLPGLAAARK